MAFIVMVGLLVAVFLVWQARSLPAAQQAVLAKRLPLYAALIGILILALSGRLHWLVAVSAALVSLLPKLFRSFADQHSANRGNGHSATSEVTSEYLRMQLDHNSGVMSGMVLKGVFNGRTLADLTRDELLTLHRECLRGDEESASLLTAYLDRTHPNWREFSDANDRQQDSPPGAGFSSTMSRAEAAEILGVAENASAELVRAAHRRLIQKMHPDHGGSTFLAAKINQAKEQLLKN